MERWREGEEIKMECVGKRQTLPQLPKKTQHSTKFRICVDFVIDHEVNKPEVNV